MSPYIFQKVGGAEISLKLIGESLAKKGHRVTFLTEDKSSGIGYSKKRINGVTVIVYSLFKNKSFFKLSDKTVTSVNNFWLKYIIYRVTKIKTIDIFHSFYELRVLEYFVKLREHDPKLKYKIVMRMAGIYWYQDIINDKNKLDRYRYVFNNIDSVNFNTSGLKPLAYARAANIGLRLNFKHEFIGDIGASVKRNRNSWKGNPGSAGIKILVATRLYYPKRQDILIEAARLLSGKIPFNIMMVGEGADSKNIQEKVNEYGLSEFISIVPFMEQEKLWAEMQKADFLCHPSEHEGLSKIIIESMMIGLPVLASDVVPLNDYIKNGVNGYLCANNPEDWAAQIYFLGRNKSNLKTISANAYNIAVENYDTDNNVTLYEMEFSRLVKKVSERSKESEYEIQ